MKVLVISDIHGDINKMEDILEEHSDSDVKIFLGDFQVSKIGQKELTAKFDFVVRGNNDYPGISQDTLLVDLDGVIAYITHGDRFFSLTEYVNKDKISKAGVKHGADIVMHGHDHKASISEHNGITVFNPGSPSFPRFGSKAAYGIIIIEDGKIIDIKNIEV